MRGLTLLALALPGLSASATQCQYQIDNLPPQAMTQVSPEARLWQDQFLVFQQTNGTTDIFTGDRLKAFLSQAYSALNAVYEVEQGRLLSCYGYCAKSPQMAKNVASAVVTIRVDATSGGHVYDIVDSGTDHMSAEGPTKESQIPALGYESALKSSSLKITCQD